MMFGVYPFDQQWRPAIAIVVLCGLLVVSAIKLFWRPSLALIWIGGLVVTFWLMARRLRPDTGALRAVGRAAGHADPGDLRHRACVSAGRAAGAGAAFEAADRQVAVGDLHRGGARRAADHRAVHGQRDVRRCSCPRACASTSCCARRSRSSCSWRPTWPKRCAAACRRCPRASTKPPRRLGLPYWKMTGLIILPQALKIVDPADRQQLHLAVQGHVAGRHHRDLRLRLRGEEVGRDRLLVEEVLHRGVPVLDRSSTGSSASRCRKYSQWLERGPDAATATVEGPDVDTQPPSPQSPPTLYRRGPAAIDDQGPEQVVRRVPGAARTST